MTISTHAHYNTHMHVQVSLMTEYFVDEKLSKKYSEIPDPYYGGRRGFEEARVRARVCVCALMCVPCACLCMRVPCMFVCVETRCCARAMSRTK